MQGAAVRVMIGPAIALHNFGRAQGLPALAANRWDRVAQQQQGGDVVAIRPPSGSLTMGCPTHRSGGGASSRVAREKRGRVLFSTRPL